MLSADSSMLNQTTGEYWKKNAELDVVSRSWYRLYYRQQKEEKAQLLMRPELSESFCIESEFGKRLLLEVFLPKLRLLFAATSGLAAAGYCRLNFLPHAACQRCRALHLCSNASWHETSSFAKAQWSSSSCEEVLFPPTRG